MLSSRLSNDRYLEGYYMRLPLASAFLMLAPSTALACLPLPSGIIEPPLPTVEQRAEAIARASDNIVYGVLTRGIANDRDGQLRILHVYKGDLRAGARVTIKNSWGFDPPTCSGMLGGPPPTPKGTKGVFAWSGEPELNGVSEDRLAVMFKRRLIIRANGR
ncbi:hypothetical protein [Sphingomonas montana]|uniref:hypothetical protein n=1 Tax=Sphingomonas montana TaxID=1843236 RepID=UPI00101ADA6C|nr:hypothetical protein [Sphingomonas montana]